MPIDVSELHNIHQPTDLNALIWWSNACLGISREMERLESVRIGKCQNWKVSELESVRIGKCQNWKVSELESVRIGKCLNLESVKSKIKVGLHISWSTDLFTNWRTLKILRWITFCGDKSVIGGFPGSEIVKCLVVVSPHPNIPTRPTFSQFRSFQIRRTTFLS